MAEGTDNMGIQKVKFRDEIVEIETVILRGIECLRLKDVQRKFPSVSAFRVGNVQKTFIQDEDGNDLKPLRIKAYPDQIIEAVEPRRPSTGIIPVTQRQDDDILGRIESKIDRIDSNTQEMLNQIRHVMTQMYELHEYTTPRYFLILPAKHYGISFMNSVRNQFQLHYKLYFLCECSDEPSEMHVAPHEGYSIKKTKEFILRYGPYLHTTLKIVKILLSIGGTVIPQLGNLVPAVDNATPSSLERENLDKLKWQLQLVDTLIDKGDVNRTRGGSSVAQANKPRGSPLQGAELRELETYLELGDNKRSLGNLYRIVTTDGHVRWVCPEHNDDISWKKEIRQYIDQLEAMGGEFNRKTKEAIVNQANLTGKHVKLLREALQKGFNITKLIFYQCSFSEGDLDKLLEIVINRSSIRGVSMTAVRVLNFFGNIKYTCEFMATEFNNHLIKVRFCDTYKDGSIPMLIRLLQQNKISRKWDFSACDFLGHEDDFRQCLEVSGVAAELIVNYCNNINLINALFTLKKNALTKLKLNHSLLEFSTLSPFCDALRKNKTLVEIDLMDHSGFEDETFVADLLDILRKHTTIKSASLHIENIKLSDRKEVCLIDSLRNGRFITRLCISKSIISSELTEALSDASVSEEDNALIYLKFYTTQVQDRDMKKLRSLYKKGNLLELTFSDQPRWLEMFEGTNVQPRRGRS